MATRVSIQGRPSQKALLGRGALALARATGVRPAEARRILEARSTIPAVFEAPAAQRLVQTLSEAGFSASQQPGPPRASAHCTAHPSLDVEAGCEECRASICAACLLSHSGRRCTDCELRRRRRNRFRNLRVAVLLGVLLGIAGWSVHRSRHLDARTQWIRTVSASVVLVSDQPLSRVSGVRWSTGVASLQEWFGREWGRYRPASPVPMITVALDGWAQVETLPSSPGRAADLAGRAREVLAFKAAQQKIDARIAEHAARDITIYVVLRPTPNGGGLVEGVAEAGGRVGMVEAVLETHDLSLELTAVAHELLHCLGATDKYDARGHAILPQGLAEPEKTPLFPQLAAEVMVGEIPTAPGEGRALTRLEEVQVGPVTAREIRW